MRFIRKEHIVTTIFNKELSDEETIRTVFSNLREHNIDFSMIMKKFLPHQQDSFHLSFDQVRVKAVNEDNTVDVLAFKKGVKTNMKHIPFDDIVEVNTTTTKHKVIDVDDATTRWEILDL